MVSEIRNGGYSETSALKVPTIVGDVAPTSDGQVMKSETGGYSETSALKVPAIVGDTAPTPDGQVMKLEIGSDICCDLMDVQGQIKLTLQPSQSAGGLPTLHVWTDVAGVVLFEWQVKLSKEAEWQLPPPAWPPSSGANGQTLQTRLLTGAEKEGQEASIQLGGFNALRWQLWCIPSMIRAPVTMQEISLELDWSKPQRMAGLFQSTSAWREAEGYVDSDDEVQGGAVLKLQLRGESKKIMLPQITLEELQTAAEREFRRDIVGCEWDAIGRVDGMLVRLDTDNALTLFLNQAAGCWIGAPTVELRVRDV